jgi:hypothetical protein
MKVVRLEMEGGKVRYVKGVCVRVRNTILDQFMMEADLNSNDGM